jgi:hypothetical protein
MVGVVLGTSTQARLSSPLADWSYTNMAEEVTVEGDTLRPYPRPALRGPTPLQTGLLYGAGGAAIGGPVGLLAGLFAGILHKRAQESYLDRVARDTYNLKSQYENVENTLQQELEIADPDEARILKDAQRTAAVGWQMLQSGDESGRDLIMQAHETARGVMNADIQARKAEQAAQFNTQRGLITSAAPALRDQYSTVINNARALDTQAQRILELTADPNFDPNKPFNKSILAELVSTSIGGMFKDDPNGLLNGLAELGSTGSEVGTIIGAFARLGKSVADTDEFKVSREEYNRIALNIREVTRRYGEQRLQEIAAQAQGLDQFARQVGAIPENYSLADYVSGGVRELQVAPEISIPNIRPIDTKQPTAAVRSAPTWQPRSTGPTTRRRPQIEAEPLQVLTPQDDWARRLLGVQTSGRRRPTN